MKFIFLIIYISFNIFLLYSNNLVEIKDKTRKEIVKELFNIVENWLGTPYLYGGDTKNGVDCSAFVSNVFKKVFNINLPRTVKEQKNCGIEISDNKFQPGDLLFFDTVGGRVSHVGIYVFNDKFIHSASAGVNTGVIKSSLQDPYFKKRFLYARRIVSLPKYIKENTEIKEVNSNNNNKEKNDCLLTGKITLKNKILLKTNNFLQSDKIFLKFESNDNSIYNLKILNKNDFLKKVNKNLEIESNKIYYINLPLGIYDLLLYDKNNKIISSKLIVVYWKFIEKSHFSINFQYKIFLKQEEHIEINKIMDALPELKTLRHKYLFFSLNFWLKKFCFSEEYIFLPKNQYFLF